LQTLPKDRLVRMAQHGRSALTKAKEVNEKVMGTVLTGAGGAAAGVLVAKYPSIRESFLDGGLAGAAALLAIGFTGMAGKNSDQAVELGQGMLAGSAAIKTHEAWLKRMAEEAKSKK